MNTFLGFRRKSGPPGIRNHVLVISGELGCNPWTLEIAAGAPGGCAVTHKHGAGNMGADRGTFAHILAGLMRHPNVAASVLVASGNEDYDPAKLVRSVAASGHQACLIALRGAGSGRTLVRRGREVTRRLLDEARRAGRVEADAGLLRIGLNCAGTDLASRTTSNAACGAAIDLLVGAGGTAILTETPELIGLNENLFRRAADRPTRSKLIRVVHQQERRLLLPGGNIDENEMCAFNFQGGLSTLRQKAAISVLKGGTSKIREVVDFGRPPTGRGLVLMDGPAFSDFVLTGLMGAGAHLMINCCGAGEANKLPAVVGADALPAIMPVIKITGSTAHFQQRDNRIDLNAAPAAKSPGALARTGAALFALVQEVASGQRTRTETTQDLFINFPMRFAQA